MNRHQIYLGIVLLALGLLSTVQSVRATESAEVDSSIHPVTEPFSQDAHVSLRVPSQALRISRQREFATAQNN